MRQYLNFIDLLLNFVEYFPIFPSAQMADEVKTKKRKLTSKEEEEVELYWVGTTRRHLVMEEKVKQAIRNVVQPYWKEEWKILVANLVDRMQLYHYRKRNHIESFHLRFLETNNDIKSINSTTTIAFADWSINSQIYSGKVNDGVSELSEVDYYSIEMVLNFPGIRGWPTEKPVRDLSKAALGLENLPHNLFFSLQYAFAATLGLTDPFPLTIENSEENLTNENVVYLLPQHYHRAYFQQSKFSRWSDCGEALLGGLDENEHVEHVETTPSNTLVVGQWSPSKTSNKWELNGMPDLNLLKLPPHETFVQLVIPVQMDKLVEYLFHYSKDKQIVAKRLAQQIHPEILGFKGTDRVLSQFYQVRDDRDDYNLITWKPAIDNNVDNNNDDKSCNWIPIYSFTTPTSFDTRTVNYDPPIELPFPSKSEDAIAEEEVYENGFNFKKHKLRRQYIKDHLTAKASSYFTEQEMGMLVEWVHRIHANNRTQKLSAIFSSLTADDHFADPADLRGRFADTEFLRLAAAHDKIIALLTAIATNDSYANNTNDVKSISQLVYSYFPFPPPTITTKQLKRTVDPLNKL